MAYINYSKGNVVEVSSAFNRETLVEYQVKSPSRAAFFLYIRLYSGESFQRFLKDLCVNFSKLISTERKRVSGWCLIIKY